MNENSRYSILIIDDDPFYRRWSASILAEKFNVFTAESPSEGFKILDKEKIKFLITDYVMPEI